jgi:hypothetical protein
VTCAQFVSLYYAPDFSCCGSVYFGVVAVDGNFAFSMVFFAAAFAFAGFDRSIYLFKISSAVSISSSGSSAMVASGGWAVVVRVDLYTCAVCKLGYPV